MKKTVWLLVCCGIGLAQAQTYRWVDEQGKAHYGDRPPPAKAGDAKLQRTAPPAPDKAPSYAMQQAVQNFPVTLYVTADCGSGCSDARAFLGKRNIPFSEIPVDSNEAVGALKQLTGGEAIVPVITVGKRVAKGFLDTHWANLLDAAGYPPAP